MTKPLKDMSDQELIQALRDHVNSKGGPAKDENGDYVLPNGAWNMMLTAADRIERLDAVIARLVVLDLGQD